MGKRIAYLAIVVLIALTSNTFAATFSGGDGSEAFPYLISDANDLLALGADPNYYSAHFKLIADIDLKGTGDNPDGSFSTTIIAPEPVHLEPFRDFDGTPFTGVFDGNDHKILNLTIDANHIRSSYFGLFGMIGENGEVTNLGIEDVNIIGSDHSYYFGGLAGYNVGKISNCYMTGSVTSEEDPIALGGLCGYNTGEIVDCHATAIITGGEYSYALGGLCGRKGAGTIANCFWDMETSGMTTSAGGSGLPRWCEKVDS